MRHLLRLPPPRRSSRRLPASSKRFETSPSRKKGKVSGDVTQYERKLSRTVRVNGSPYDDAVATFETSMDVPEGVFDQGAKQIVRIADPYTLAASRFGEGDYNDALALIYRTL